jgi:hypothetical protein
MTEATPAAAAEPRTTPTIVPTPRPVELTGFLNAMAAGTLPRPTWSLSMDGSAVDPKSFNPAPITTPTWP